MTLNQNFKNWKIRTEGTDGKFVVEHKRTGETLEFNEDGELSHQSSDVESGPGSVLNAAPGEVQEKIDTLVSSSEIGINAGQSRGLIRLYSQETYDEGEEIHVKPGITLDFNGAVLTHSEDHNLLFLDNGTRATNIQIATNGDSFSSDAVVLDTARSTYGKYSIGTASGRQNTHAVADGTILGDSSQAHGGTGLALRDGADEAITMGCRFDMDIYYMDDGLGFYTGDMDNGSFINFGNIDVSITGCHTLINHTGAAPARSHVTGTLQPTTPTEYMIRNQSTDNNISVIFDGQFWDPHGGNTYAVAGPKVSIWAKHSLPADALPGNDFFDGASNQIVVSTNEKSFQLYLGESDTCWTWKNEVNGRLKVIQSTADYDRVIAQFGKWGDGGQLMVTNENGNTVSIIGDSSGMPKIGNPDSTIGEVYLGLRSSTPHSANGTKDTYQDDGTNTSDGIPRWRVDDPADSTWKDM